MPKEIYTQLFTAAILSTITAALNIAPNSPVMFNDVSEEHRAL
jgi:hypothetical protein